MKQPTDSGFILPALISFMVAILIVSGAVLTLVLTNLNVVTNNLKSQQAFNIAEAGVNYYLWHLSHNSTDFKDGTGSPSSPDPSLGYGPYEHTYVDDNAKTQGTYTLWINPGPTGSTLVKVRSIGKVKGSTITRTVDAQIGAPSFASYGVASDTALWFGATESASGPVHSNQGIRMDGASDSDITSANTLYTPSAQLGGNGQSHPGVWCSTTVTSPVNCNNRSKSDWRYPVPTIDFNVVNSSLCTMKKIAFGDHPSTESLKNQANACTQVPNTRTNAYLPQRATNGSYNRSRGWLIELNTNGTYNVLEVNNETDSNASYSTALSLVNIASNVTLPASGVIFAEDNVWVRSNPTFHGRVTIAAGRLATTSSANITVADDLIYSTKNGADAVGLVTEDSIYIAPYAPPQSGSFNFEVNAAMIAQSGSVTYPLRYRSNNACTKGWVNNNQTFAFYGSIATRQTWTWTWLVGSSPCGSAAYSAGNGYISGVLNNSTTYDYNLLYAPPPSFPVTSSFNVISWREVLTKP